jgi:hypothetical protein
MTRMAIWQSNLAIGAAPRLNLVGGGGGGSFGQHWVARCRVAFCGSEVWSLVTSTPPPPLPVSP